MMRHVKFRTYSGNWKNDDVDITPTIKINTGSKKSECATVFLTYISLCWLKWALIIEFSRIYCN